MLAYSHHGLFIALLYSPSNLQFGGNVPIVKSQEMGTKVDIEICRKKIMSICISMALHQPSSRSVFLSSKNRD